MVAKLKQSFLAPSSSVATRESLPHEADHALIGALSRVPVCRWPWEILPHHQVVLVVHEPQYTLMFERVLASKAPHRYMHCMLPGGTSNLGVADYALKPGTRAPLQGTLMEIVSVLREPDSRLVLIVQGIARAHVLRETQQLPYSRADVQILPDAEALRSAARASRRWLREAKAVGRTNAPMRQRLALAAAVAEDNCWRGCAYSSSRVEDPLHVYICHVPA